VNGQAKDFGASGITQKGHRGTSDVRVNILGGIAIRMFPIDSFNSARQ
jgi:hypothetical protein